MSGSLAGEFERWRAQPLGRHLGALALLLAVAVLRWWPSTTYPEPLPDELDYLQAFQHVVRGESPYLVNFYYPPGVAVLGATVLERFGLAATLAALRIPNLLGLVFTVWCAAGFLPLSYRTRLLAGSAFLAVAQVARIGLAWGNLSFLVSGLILLGFVLWPRRPVLSGMVLGSSIAIKPLAPLAVALLFLHRPAEGGRRHQMAAVVAGLVAMALVLPFPYLREMLALHEASRLPLGTLSIHRIPQLLGLEVSSLLLSAVVAGIVLLGSRGRRYRWPELLYWIPTATLLATPVVWNHTLLLVLPLQAAALAVVWSRWREAGADRSVRRGELVFVLLAAAAIQLSWGACVIRYAPVWFQGVAAFPPAVAPLLLTLYLLVGPGAESRSSATTR